MVLELKLRKVGNSVGVVLPKEALAHLNVQEGDTVCVTDAADGTLRISATDPGVHPPDGSRARHHAPLSQRPPRTGEVKTPVWVRREAVVAVQEQLLAGFGGASRCS